MDARGLPRLWLMVGMGLPGGGGGLALGCAGLGWGLALGLGLGLAPRLLGAVYGGLYLYASRGGLPAFQIGFDVAHSPAGQVIARFNGLGQFAGFGVTPDG